MTVDEDVRAASTLPAAVYTDPDLYSAQIERAFAPAWHLAPAPPAAPRAAEPWTLMPGSLDEPLVWTRDENGGLHCLSNVCTHRAARVVDRVSCGPVLRCRYHGRRFTLDGRFLSMPEFETASGFPAPSDDLLSLATGRWGPLTFVTLGADVAFDEWIGPVRARIDALGPETWQPDAEAARDYDVRAHWALYCDNYLEGFHIPFVHQALAAAIEYGSYRTETWPHGSLQIAIAREGEPAFDLPAGHPDFGERIAGYYVWLFPNLMLNFYPWGLSVNVVEPVAIDRTRVRFLCWVADAAFRGRGAGGDLHGVELEDEEVVESVQIGVRSRLYDRGRFSPTRETGVHHFHRILARTLGSSG